MIRLDYIHCSRGGIQRYKPVLIFRLISRKEYSVHCALLVEGKKRSKFLKRKKEKKKRKKKKKKEKSVTDRPRTIDQMEAQANRKHYFLS